VFLWSVLFWLAAPVLAGAAHYYRHRHQPTSTMKLEVSRFGRSAPVPAGLVLAGATLLRLAVLFLRSNLAGAAHYYRHRHYPTLTMMLFICAVLVGLAVDCLSVGTLLLVLFRLLLLLSVGRFYRCCTLQ
jgi:hypothetical protein